MSCSYNREWQIVDSVTLNKTNIDNFNVQGYKTVCLYTNYFVYLLFETSTQPNVFVMTSHLTGWPVKWEKSTTLCLQGFHLGGYEYHPWLGTCWVLTRNSSGTVSVGVRMPTRACSNTINRMASVTAKSLTMPRIWKHQHICLYFQLGRVDKYSLCRNETISGNHILEILTLNYAKTMEES